MDGGGAAAGAATAPDESAAEAEEAALAADEAAFASVTPERLVCIREQLRIALQTESYGSLEDFRLGLAHADYRVAMHLLRQDAYGANVHLGRCSRVLFLLAKMAAVDDETAASVFALGGLLSQVSECRLDLFGTTVGMLIGELAVGSPERATVIAAYPQIIRALATDTTTSGCVALGALASAGQVSALQRAGVIPMLEALARIDLEPYNAKFATTTLFCIYTELMIDDTALIPEITTKLRALDMFRGTPDGVKSIHVLARFCNANAIRLFGCLTDADVNVQLASSTEFHTRGDTAAHVAARCGNVVALRGLAEVNADFALVNKDGDDPIAVARADVRQQVRFICTPGRRTKGARSA